MSRLSRRRLHQLPVSCPLQPRFRDKPTCVLAPRRSRVMAPQHLKVAQHIAGPVPKHQSAPLPHSPCKQDVRDEGSGASPMFPPARRVLHFPWPAAKSFALARQLETRASPYPARTNDPAPVASHLRRITTDFRSMKNAQTEVPLVEAQTLVLPRMQRPAKRTNSTTEQSAQSDEQDTGAWLRDCVHIAEPSRAEPSLAGPLKRATAPHRRRWT